MLETWLFNDPPGAVAVRFGGHASKNAVTVAIAGCAAGGDDIERRVDIVDASS